MRNFLSAVVLLAAAVVVPSAQAQQADASSGAGAPLQAEALAAQDASQLAWDKWIDLGVAEVVSPAPEEEETYSGPRPLVELITNKPELNWESNFWPQSEMLYAKASGAILRRQLWTFEFAFKPVRMMEVDVPQFDGRMERKKIWYMIYRVRYLGNDLNPTPTEDQWGQTLFETQTVTYEHRRFLPMFILESHEYDKAYVDRIIPTAQQAIEQRETPGNKLYNTVEITRLPVPLSDARTDRGVTGVVMWEDVDPRIDFFSVYVQGLTNAYRFDDPQGAYQAGQPPGTGRQYLSKTLQLNFWRPGDTVGEHEKEISYGVPVDPDPLMQEQILEQFGLEERLDHRWVYR